MIKDPRGQIVQCAHCPLFFVCLEVNCLDATKCPLVIAVQAVKK